MLSIFFIFMLPLLYFIEKYCKDKNMNTPIFPIVSELMLFYISWIYYRLIVMPQNLYSMLIITLQSQSYTNIVVCIIQGILTLMGIKWSRDLIISKIRKEKTSTGL